MSNFKGSDAYIEKSLILDNFISICDILLTTYLFCAII